MKKLFIGLASIAMTITIIGIVDANAASKLPVVRIGIVRDGPRLGRFPDVIGLIKREILTLTTGQFDVRFPSAKNVHGNDTNEGVERVVDQLLADPEVDLVIGLGYLASNDLAQRRKLPKPVIAPAVADAKLQNLPLKQGASGIKNLVYIDSFVSIDRDVKVFLDIVPFRNLAVLVRKETLEAAPWIKQKLRRISFEHTINVEPVPVGNSAEVALADLPPETDAVYVFPLLYLNQKEFFKLVAGLIERKLPSFSMWGRSEVEAGLLASNKPKADLSRIARRIALNVQRILLGEDAGTFNVAFPEGEELTINMATARAIGVYPTWSVLTEAELLHERVTEVERKLSLQSVVREAIEANLDIAVENSNVAAGEQSVKQARSALLPQIDLDAGGVVIDEDRADARFGLQPERSLTGSATARQLIYSDDAWTNFSVEKRFQTSREEQRETVKLDIARDAAVSYLNVLRTKTSERIQKENLRLTRANLERARVRVSIGIASRAEEFRWESEIATSRQFVLRAQARRQQAETNLNRLLNRPLEEPFLTEETDLSDPLLLVSDKRFFYYVDNPRNFSLFRNFLVEEGLNVAPELKRLDATIEAQERILVSSKRAFWLPTFAIEGNVTELLAEGGAGQRKDSPSGQDDTDWSVGAFATFPLLEGGNKFATTKRAAEELSGLRLERRSTAEKIAERIRVTLDETGFSYPSIRLSREGEIAARKNLDLVTDQYVRGVVSIIDLLDAQNNALVAEEDAQNAVYNFLIDLMNVQRATGQFDFFLSREQREVWFQRLGAFFKKAGVQPIRR